MLYLINLLTGYFFFTFVNSHSWVECSNYQAEITGNDYAQGECDGWVRGWDFSSTAFGVDRGINYQVSIGNGGNICRDSLSGDSSSSYSGSYGNSDKLAHYTVGSTVRVVWPAKNHANYECNSYIPDASMKLYMNPNVNPTSDLPNTASDLPSQGYTLVKDWQDGCTAGSDGCGFQNCPKFCEGTDKATCYGDFVVPTVSTSGYYTFVWYWIFNPNTDPYTSCWEAYIDTTGTTSTPNDASGGSSGGDTVNGYIVQMPACITGQSYIESSLLTFVENQFSDVDSSDISIVDVSDETNSYNFTAQFSLSSSEVKGVTSTAATFCDDFEAIYAGTTCDNCADTVVYALYKSSANKIYTFIGILVTVAMAIIVV